MKQTYRFNTFETNSSTTHNIVIIPDEEWEAWEKGEIYYIQYVWGDKLKNLVKNNNGKMFYTKQELVEAGIFDDMPKRENYDNDYDYEDDLNDYIQDNDFLTYSTWESRELESDHHEYITKSGDKIHILCEYGYDG